MNHSDLSMTTAGCKSWPYCNDLLQSYVRIAGTNRVSLTLAASSGNRYVSVWRPSVRILITLIGHATHTQRDSPGSSTRRGQRTFSSEY